MATVCDYYNGTTDGQDWAYALYRYAQSFTGNGGVLQRVIIKGAKYGSPTGSVYVKIYAHSGTFGTSSVPTGSVLATSDAVDISTVSSSAGEVTFTFTSTNKITLTNGTYYVLVLDFPTGTNWTDCILIYKDSSSPTHSGNQAYSDGGGTWTAASGVDNYFYVYTDASSPSPSLSPSSSASPSSSVSPSLSPSASVSPSSSSSPSVSPSVSPSSSSSPSRSPSSSRSPSNSPSLSPSSSVSPSLSPSLSPSSSVSPSLSPSLSPSSSVSPSLSPSLSPSSSQSPSQSPSLSPSSSLSPSASVSPSSSMSQSNSPSPSPEVSYYPTISISKSDKPRLTVGGGSPQVKVTK